MNELQFDVVTEANAVVLLAMARAFHSEDGHPLTSDGEAGMLALMAISCNLLVGYGERRKGELFLFVLPIIVSLSFFVIADLDSPFGGVIRVYPQNLAAASQSMK